jgi:hypothetical protein
MWKHQNTYAIGGLENVGYANGQDLLIALSTQGEGIFDCIKGEDIARLNNSSDWWNDFNKQTNSIRGFDLLEGIEIKTFGLYGEDKLPKSTEDGWMLLTSEPEPDDSPFEQYLVKKVYLVSPDKMEKRFLSKDGACELRTFGFSSTGNSFIIATSFELIIYSRE